MVKLGRGKFLTMKKPRQSKFKKLMYTLKKEEQMIVNNKLNREFKKGYEEGYKGRYANDVRFDIE